MGKKLAIKGRETRGKEVIDLLEMMGGKNIYNLHGLLSEFAYYFIGGSHNTEIRAGEYIFGDEDMYLFTCEEFWEKYPFKVGDKVKYGCGETLIIKSMSWSEDCETMVYDFEKSDVVLTAEDIRFAYDADEDNTKPTKMKNVLAELLEHIKTTPKEELEREFEEISEWSNVGPTVEEFMDFCNKVNKKPKYPDNYEECVRIAKNIHGYDIHIDTPAYSELIESFVKLLICRDAYWKILGEEMGLGKSWEPDWKHGKDKFYCICTTEGEIVLGEWYIDNKILAFPTIEMRDIFYENFKDLIEQCKSLL